MAKINQALLDRLVDKLGVSKARVYTLIQQISAKNRVPRHLGALLLAGEHNISVQKYASSQDLADLRGVPHATSVPAGVLEPTSSQRLAARRGKARPPTKTKENTVFVVHGRDERLRDAMYQLLGALGLRSQEWATRFVRRAEKEIHTSTTRSQGLWSKRKQLLARQASC